MRGAWNEFKSHLKKKCKKIVVLKINLNNAKNNIELNNTILLSIVKFNEQDS